MGQTLLDKHPASTLYLYGRVVHFYSGNWYIFSPVDTSIADSIIVLPTGDVAKWFKATDCKSVIRGFESPRLLQQKASKS